MADPFNPSSVNLDPTKGNVFQIQYQWLGFGAINFFIESDATGKYVPVHQIKYANSELVPSSYNPTFPIRAEVNNGTSTDVLTMKSASMAAFVEGKNVISGPLQSASSGGDTGGADSGVLLLSNDTVFPSGSTTTNRVVAYLRNLSIAVDAANNNDVCRIQIVDNPTWTGQTYTYVDGQESIIRYAPFNSGAYVGGTGKVINTLTFLGDGAKEIDLTAQNIAIRPGRSIGFVTQGDVVSNIQLDISWVEDF
jgi:hypothetical protein